MSILLFRNIHLNELSKMFTISNLIFFSSGRALLQTAVIDSLIIDSSMDNFLD